jgi:Raf kinase inhibitor-like YbhB/YbcL family protein
MNLKNVFAFGILMTLLATDSALASGFTLKSPELKNGGVMAMEQVFNSFGCTGKNISPELVWTNAPKATKSFALTVYDPDAPTGSGWWHWTVFNIPANTTKLEKNAGAETQKLPAGSVQGRTDFGQPGYGGACPPVGDKPHKYFFTVFALKVEKIDLTSEASGAMVGYYLNQNALAKAKLMVKFSR